MKSLTENQPDDVEALQLQEDGMQLVPRLDPRAMRLHGDESMFDQRFSQVVQLAGVHPAGNDKQLSRPLALGGDGVLPSVLLETLSMQI